MRCGQCQELIHASCYRGECPAGCPGVLTAVLQDDIRRIVFEIQAVTANVTENQEQDAEFGALIQEMEDVVMEGTDL
jgi:hypothetical protein